ncbi:MAG: hypothetical protein LC779_10700 [Actinobacteria bacterium]|nr:hypothetical protein [Actinomycetota bacterium]
MTAVTTARSTTTEDRLRTVLRADAVVTGLVGIFALESSASLYGDVPGWLPRVVGAVLLLVAADLAVASRWSGQRLRLAGTVVAELALAWVAATTAVLVFRDLPGTGTEVLLVVGAATLAFGVAELRLVRSLAAGV